MKILFVVGSCLKSNSSANLCHMAYIKGAIENGHQVEVLSVSDKDVPIDKGIKLPKEIKWINYNSAFYTRYSYKKSLKNVQETNVVNSGNDEKKADINLKGIRGIVRNFKNRYIESLGIFGFDTPWVKRASNFRNSEKYDMVISLAWPPASHEATRILLEKKHIYTTCWCQIWEDPWYLDLWMDKDLNKYETEKKLISKADKVMYVSPITLKYQKEAFSEYANKMFWEPLPFYYVDNDQISKKKDIDKIFGYYGDYHPHIRNLSEFYFAAKEVGAHVNIFGNPSNLFEKTDKINISPRVGIDILKEAERNTDIMVFVCNVKGGQIPGKLYQYSSTDKAILFILDGTEEEIEEIRKYYERYHRYIFCRNEKEEIKHVMKKLIADETFDVVNERVEDFTPKNIFKRIMIECM